LLSRLFYWPGDLLATKTDARQRRAISVWLFLVFCVLFSIWPNAVWLVGLMSIVAILGVVSGETPVEDET
jgi:hypothetical protein